MRVGTDVSRAVVRVLCALDQWTAALDRWMAALDRWAAQPRDDRGDVPGWVMVTVMTAGLVAAVFAVFREAIVVAVQTALAQVVSGTGG
jgi:hypothetical protein